MTIRPIAVVQARMGSTRMPGKVLRPIMGRPMLWHIVRRLRYVQELADLVVATSDRPGDEPVRAFCRESGIPVFAGSEEDVLDRFYRAACEFKGDPLVRVTGDCPFVDPELVKQLLNFYMEGNYDHAGIATGAGAIFLKAGRFPDGLDAECISFSSLERAWREATDPADREHVTPYIWRNKSLFRCGLMESDTDFSKFRWTVDHEADFDFVSRVYFALYDENNAFLMKDILSYISKYPEITVTNQDFIGKEGYRKLWGPDKQVRKEKHGNK